MVLRDLFLDTFRTLWANKLRTALTMFGIAWGIVSITLMVAAGEGLRVGQERVAASFGKNIMIVFAGRTSMQAGGTRAGRGLQWEANDYKFIEEQCPAVEHAVPELGQGSIPVRSPFNNGSFMVTGSLPVFADIRTIDVESGRFYNDDDNRMARRVCIIGSEVYKQLFAGREAVGTTIQVGDFPYLIIGVMRSKDQDSSYDGQDISKVFVPFGAMLRDFPNKPPAKPTSVDRLIVTPKSFEQNDEAKRQVRRALATVYNFDPKDEEAAPIWDTVENAKQFRMMTDSMKYFLGAVGLTTLFLGGIGVMNVMMVAVRERTREIGVRKAVGATAREILWQFFCETLIVVFFSGAVGMGTAYGFCALVNMLPMPAFFAGLMPTMTSTLLSFGLLSTVAILSALYPASRAASIDPIEALRYEAGS